MKIKELISEIFCPSKIKCVMCDNEVFEESRFGLCKKCILPLNRDFCYCCGVAQLSNSPFCEKCVSQPPIFTMARAPLVYTDSLHRAIYKLKYGGGQYLAKYFAKIMAGKFIDYEWKVDEITFVPMHKKKQKVRGYNQAEVLAREFAGIVDLPLVACLERKKYTSSLARMNRRERQKAIEGTISCIEGVKPAKSILLIDDVFTSGSTVSECARVLKKGGAKAVYVMTIATSRRYPVLYGARSIGEVSKEMVAHWLNKSAESNTQK